MVKIPRGYTLFELIFLILFVMWIGVVGWVISLIIRALMKYVGS
jgi:hypothetical protein